MIRAYRLFGSFEHHIKLPSIARRCRHGISESTSHPTHSHSPTTNSGHYNKHKASISATSNRTAPNSLTLTLNPSPAEIPVIMSSCAKVGKSQDMVPYLKTWMDILITSNIKLNPTYLSRAIASCKDINMTSLEETQVVATLTKLVTTCNQRFENNHIATCFVGFGSKGSNHAQIRELLSVLAKLMSLNRMKFAESEFILCMNSLKYMSCDSPEVLEVVKSLTEQILKYGPSIKFSEQLIASLLQGVRNMKSDSLEIRQYIDAVSEHIAQPTQSVEYTAIVAAEGKIAEPLATWSAGAVIAACEGLANKSCEYSEIRNIIRCITLKLNGCSEPLSSKFIMSMLEIIKSMNPTYSEVRNFCRTVASKIRICKDMLTPSQLVNAIAAVSELKSEYGAVMDLLNAINGKMKDCTTSFQHHHLLAALDHVGRMPPKQFAVQEVITTIIQKSISCRDKVTAQQFLSYFEALGSIDGPAQSIIPFYKLLFERFTDKANPIELSTGQTMRALFIVNKISGDSDDIQHYLLTLLSMVAPRYIELSAADHLLCLDILCIRLGDNKQFYKLFLNWLEILKNSEVNFSLDEFVQLLCKLEMIRHHATAWKAVIPVLEGILSQNADTFSGTEILSVLNLFSGLTEEEFTAFCPVIEACTPKIESCNDSYFIGQLMDIVSMLSQFTGSPKFVRRLANWLANKIADTTEVIGVDEFIGALRDISRIGLEHDEYKTLLESLNSKFKQCEEPATAQQVLDIISYLSAVDTNAEVVRNVTLQTAGKINSSSDYFMESDAIARSLVLMQGFRDEYPEVRNLLGALAVKCSECRRRLLSHQIVSIMTGLQTLDASHREVRLLLKQIKRFVDRNGERWKPEEIAKCIKLMSAMSGVDAPELRELLLAIATKTLAWPEDLDSSAYQLVIDCLHGIEKQLQCVEVHNLLSSLGNRVKK